LPWNAVATEIGLPLSFSNRLMASTAWPSATFGLRLNDIVAEGNMPWWLMTMGAGLMSLCTNVESGTCWLVDELT
jgi:hypothetical protein